MELQFEKIYLSEYQESGKLYDGNVPVALVIAEGSIHRGESTETQYRLRYRYPRHSQGAQR